MGKAEVRLCAASLVSYLGNWLTFLGLFLLVQRRFGVASVGGAFLVQSVPAIVFSRRLPSLVPGRRTHLVFVTSQLGLALASGLLTLGIPNLATVYLFLVVSVTLRSLANPLFMALIKHYVGSDALEHTYTRVGATQSIALIVAPSLGGLIATLIGYRWLFAIDAATFLVVVALLRAPPPTLPAGEGAGENWRRSLFRRWVRRPFRAWPPLEVAFAMWFLYAAFGAVLNGIEFPAMASAHFSDTLVGITLGSWGIGNGIAVALTKRLTWLPTLVLVTALGCGVGLWLRALPWTAISGFALAGFSYALLSGRFRTDLARAMRPDENEIEVWAYANQGVQVVNLICYGVVTLLLAGASFVFLKIALGALAVMLAGAVLAVGTPRSLHEPGTATAD